MKSLAMALTLTLGPFFVFMTTQIGLGGALTVLGWTAAICAWCALAVWLAERTFRGR